MGQGNPMCVLRLDRRELAGDPATDGSLPVIGVADTGAGPGSPALARPGVPRA